MPIRVVRYAVPDRHGVVRHGTVRDTRETISPRRAGNWNATKTAHHRFALHLLHFQGDGGRNCSEPPLILASFGAWGSLNVWYPPAAHSRDLGEGHEGPVVFEAGQRIDDHRDPGLVQGGHWVEATGHDHAGLPFGNRHAQ